MKIKSVDVYRYNLPLVEALPVAGRTLAVRSGLFVRVESDDGAVGLGEAAPLPGYSPDSLEEAAQQAVGLGDLAGQDVPEGVERLDGAFDAWVGGRLHAPSARCGFEAAVLNLLASSRGVPLRRLIAADAGGEVAVLGLLNGNLGEIRNKAVFLQKEGYQAVKLKVGRYELTSDVQTAKWLCHHLGTAVSLRLDANRAWDFETASSFFAQTEECSFGYIEEPLDDPSRFTEFADATGARLALDETLRAVPPEGLNVVPHVSTVILKPTVLGLEKSVRLARRARTLGITPVVSSCFESGWGLFTLAQVAAAVQPPGMPAGLDTYEWLDDDVFEYRLPIRQSVLRLEELEPLVPPVALGRLEKLAHV